MHLALKLINKKTHSGTYIKPMTAIRSRRLVSPMTVFKALLPLKRGIKNGIPNLSYKFSYMFLLKMVEMIILIHSNWVEVLLLVKQGSKRLDRPANPEDEGLWPKKLLGVACGSCLNINPAYKTVSDIPFRRKCHATWDTSLKPFKIMEKRSWFFKTQSQHLSIVWEPQWNLKFTQTLRTQCSNYVPYLEVTFGVTGSQS